MKAARLVIPAVRWHEDTGFEHEYAAIDGAIAAGVGGFIVFGGTAPQVLALVDRVTRLAGRPLLIAADLERGAGQQVEGLAELPPPAALATLDDLGAVRQAGLITARSARSVGINWVLAPVADLDLEPANPIVQTRSFGAAPDRVAQLVAAWIDGARAGGALTAVKHFPGHGRTVHDSHQRMPVVAASDAELAATDLVPFRAAIAAGADAVMTAHVAFPALDPSGTPATRSRPILERLRGPMGFDGLVVTDALVMEGFAGGIGAARAAVEAVSAGVDVLLYPADVSATIAALEGAAALDPEFARAVEAALARYAYALDRASSRFELPAVPYSKGPDAADAGFAADLARRLLTEAPPVPLRTPIELVVVDDDVDGAFPASPSNYVSRALARQHVPLGSGGSRVVLAFAEPRASKGRGGFGDRSRTLLAAEVPGADLVVLFGHPRLRDAIPEGVPVVQAWHRQRLMQEAVAAWLIDQLGG